MNSLLAVEGPSLFDRYIHCTNAANHANRIGSDRVNPYVTVDFFRNRAVRAYRIRGMELTDRLAYGAFGMGNPAVLNNSPILELLQADLPGKGFIVLFRGRIEVLKISRIPWAEVEQHLLRLLEGVALAVEETTAIELRREIDPDDD